MSTRCDNLAPKNTGRCPSHVTGGGSLHLTTCLAAALLVAAIPASPAAAQANPPASGRDRPFEISDNSFLVEEALNQEPGIFQNIVNAGVDHRDEWVATFTQEWPIVSRTHQLSFTIPYSEIGTVSGMGDAAVHYRLQMKTGEDSWPAFSPRVSLIVPSGRSSHGLGRGHPGWEVNLPFSKQVRDFYFHWNAGFTHFPVVDAGSVERSLWVPRIAASGIYRLRPMLNLMLEAVAEHVDDDTQASPRYTTRFTLVPGVRTGWDIGDAQAIVGAGIPLSFFEGSRQAAVFLYFSYELPFAH